VLNGLPVILATFPIKYLGLKLPEILSFSKNINVAARGALIKSVLTSQAIFHLTPLTISLGVPS
jgi:hypothetical protein